MAVSLDQAKQIDGFLKTLKQFVLIHVFCCTYCDLTAISVSFSIFREGLLRDEGSIPFSLRIRIVGNKSVLKVDIKNFGFEEPLE